MPIKKDFKHLLIFRKLFPELLQILIIERKDHIQR